jgi:hypothetical protein
MADLEDEILKGGFRLAAVETILIDFMATAHMSGSRPGKSRRSLSRTFPKYARPESRTK